MNSICGHGTHSLVEKLDCPFEADKVLTPEFI